MRRIIFKRLIKNSTKEQNDEIKFLMNCINYINMSYPFFILPIGLFLSSMRLRVNLNFKERRKNEASLNIRGISFNVVELHQIER
jgi:hypothetical protein